MNELSLWNEHFEELVDCVATVMGGTALSTGAAAWLCYQLAIILIITGFVVI